MRKVIANERMTLDGIVQAPSYADEDVTDPTGRKRRTSSPCW